MHIAQRILRELRKGPATSPELGAILFPKMSMRAAMRRASGNLCVLRTAGRIHVIGKVQRDGKRGNKNMSNLYALKKVPHDTSDL